MIHLTSQLRQYGSHKCAMLMMEGKNNSFCLCSFLPLCAQPWTVDNLHHKPHQRPTSIASLARWREHFEILLLFLGADVQRPPMRFSLFVMWWRVRQRGRRPISLYSVLARYPIAIHSVCRYKAR